MVDYLFTLYELDIWAEHFKWILWNKDSRDIMWEVVLFFLLYRLLKTTYWQHRKWQSRAVVERWRSYGLDSSALPWSLLAHTIFLSSLPHWSLSLGEGYHAGIPFAALQSPSLCTLRWNEFLLGLLSVAQRTFSDEQIRIPSHHILSVDLRSFQANPKSHQINCFIPKPQFNTCPREDVILPGQH